MLVAVILNIAALILFKYGLARKFELTDTVVLLGVSYYTFEALASLHSAYLGYSKKSAPLNVRSFLTFMLYFPKIAQGPIERESSFVSQLRNLEHVGI